MSRLAKALPQKGVRVRVQDSHDAFSFAIEKPSQGLEQVDATRGSWFVVRGSWSINGFIYYSSLDDASPPLFPFPARSHFPRAALQ